MIAAERALQAAIAQAAKDAQTPGGVTAADAEAVRDAANQLAAAQTVCDNSPVQADKDMSAKLTTDEKNAGIDNIISSIVAASNTDKSVNPPSNVINVLNASFGGLFGPVDAADVDAAFNAFNTQYPLS